MAAEHDIDLLVQEAFFPSSISGVLIEVGAGRPDYLSISASFRARGWKVVSVEPNPIFCALHRSLGFSILQYAASDTEADDVEFFIVDSHGSNYMDGNVSFESFSSLGISGQYADLHKTVKGSTTTHSIRVKVRKLDTILAQHEPAISKIDVVAVDVEGWELNVMRGLSIERYRPRVIILENLFNDPGYAAHMEKCGYGLWRQVFPNDIYVAT